MLIMTIMKKKHWSKNGGRIYPAPYCSLLRYI